MYKLTGNKIPYPFPTCSLFLSCDICIKNTYISEINASGSESISSVSPLSHQKLVGHQRVTVEFPGLGSFGVNGHQQTWCGQHLGLKGFVALACTRSHCAVKDGLLKGLIQSQILWEAADITPAHTPRAVRQNILAQVMAICVQDSISNTTKFSTFSRLGRTRLQLGSLNHKAHI